MIRKLSALLAAMVVALTTFAPVEADAQDRRGHWDRGGYDRDYDRRRWRDRDHDHDAVAAGAVGLIVGLALGSLASQNRNDGCYDRRCAPPPRPRDCYDPCGYDDSYYREDPRYYDERSAYEREYGYDPYDRPPPREQCTRRERQWDRYADRYVTVDVPC